MFIPNRFCYIRRKSPNTDMYGQRTYGDKEKIPYALVRYDTLAEESTVRADSSATRGNIKEIHSTGKLLVKPVSAPLRGDLLVVEGLVFMIKEIEPRFNVLGRLDHYEIDFEKFDDLFGDEA